MQFADVILPVPFETFTYVVPPEMEGRVGEGSHVLVTLGKSKHYAGVPLVAHNSPFDEGCLKEVFKVYQMDYPDYTFYDTCAASRRHFGHRLPDHQLQTVAAACGYDLQRHHHALADAEACAAIALRLL